MKRYLWVITLVSFCCLAGCNNENQSKTPEITTEAVFTDEAEEVSESSTVDEVIDAANRTMIAETMGIEEDNREIRFLLSCLNTIHAGEIKKAKLGEQNDSKVIDIVAEDDTEYRIYLSNSGSVEAVENLSTGEWPMISER